MKLDSDSTTRTDDEVREKLKLYSFQLSQQADRMSEMRALISELEAHLSCRAQVIEEVRAQLSDVSIDQPTKTASASASAVADETSVGPDGSARIVALPEQVPVGRTVGFTEINWETGDGSEGRVYVSVDGEPETLFATGPSGSKRASWIVVGQFYEFRLYAGTQHDCLLKKVNVVGTQIPLPESREVVRGVLDAPLRDLSDEPYLEVSGWAYSTEAPISWVEAFLDDMPLGLMTYGEPRSDVTTDSTSTVSADCGFSGRFFLKEGSVDSTTLRVRVADESGNIRDFPMVTRRPKNERIAAISTGTAPPRLRDALSAAKNALVSLAEISLDSFLASNSTIEFPPIENPEISIILVLYNRAELTLQCLYSILRSGLESYEVVIVDNASSDKTSRLLKQITGPQIIQNETNVQFLRGCNQAVERANGKYVLLLNNDAQLVAGSISSALRTLNSSDDIGAVGGKIVLPDGTLQEAGSIVWRDGSCVGYGRGDSPFAPAYMYQRDVDYCSGAFLLTNRELFLEGGGFDEDYSPAYYEETDYCVRLWKKGKRVVYDPRATILHYEFASSSSRGRAIDLQIEHRKTFAGKHMDWLQSQPDVTEGILVARSHGRKGQRRILFLDDQVPHPTLGAGFPRTNRILAELVNLGHAVTFYPTLWPREDWGEVYQDIPSEVEVMLDHGLEKLREFLSQRNDYYDVIIVSRPHNMASFKSVLAENPGICARSKIIYDAEALHSYREIEQRRLEGQELSAVEQARLIREEISLAENCNGIVTVSVREGREFSGYGLKHVHALGHSIEIAPTERSFEERKDFLFVGPINFPTSPNADSIIWFSENILPLVQKSLGKEINLIVVGLTCHGFRTRVKHNSVQFLGKVDDLTPLYNRARLFIAPTRFSAGIPLKVCDAAANGLPAVATSLVGLQLGWENERELLLADDPQSFADACVRLYTNRLLWNRLRDNMIKRAGEDFSPKRFSEQLRRIVE